jgi:hypothetical protein
LQTLQTDGKEELPGISIKVRNAKGEEVQFSHHVGENPADEADAFCTEHFPKAPTADCVEAMLGNLQAGWEEALEKEQRGAMLAEYLGGGEDEAAAAAAAAAASAPATGTGGRRRRGGLFKLPGSEL